MGVASKSAETEVTVRLYYCHNAQASARVRWKTDLNPFPQVVKEFWAQAQSTGLLLYSSVKGFFLFTYSSPAVFMGRSSSTLPL